MVQASAGTSLLEIGVEGGVLLGPGGGRGLDMLRSGGLGPSGRGIGGVGATNGADDVVDVVVFRWESEAGTVVGGGSVGWVSVGGVWETRVNAEVSEGIRPHGRLCVGPGGVEIGRRGGGGRVQGLEGKGCLAGRRGWGVREPWLRDISVPLGRDRERGVG